MTSTPPPAVPSYASPGMLRQLGWSDEAIRELRLARKRETQRERRRQLAEIRRAYPDGGGDERGPGMRPTPAADGHR